MLTRVSKARAGSPTHREVGEPCSVGTIAKEPRHGASSAVASGSAGSRQAGSGTKRVCADGKVSTFPRGANRAASLVPSRTKGKAKGQPKAVVEVQPASGNACVFVLDKAGRPLMPTNPARARVLLGNKRAVVVHLHPFTIRLKERTEDAVQPLVLLLDPGSKATGIAIARVTLEGARHALWLGELLHRGLAISKALKQRRALRHGRRSRNLRYRAPGSGATTCGRPKGWLAPSLKHRVATTESQVRRLRAVAPIAQVGLELVRFDTQAMENPEISGVEYQQGTLLGYEVREYVLEKFHHTCVYCDAKDVPFNLDHIHPKGKGGSNRVSNLALSCRPCNEAKDDRDIQEFLTHDPERLKRVLAQCKAPLKDAAAVNTTRWALFTALQKTGLPIEVATGGRTKWNRTRFNLPKTHAIDALCVGAVEAICGWSLPTLVIKATGRGSYKRTRVTDSGFPNGYLMRQKAVHGFRTGDLVRAVVPTGKKAGVHQGRVAVRATGNFNIQTLHTVVQGIHHRHCQILMRGDGYTYRLNPDVPVERHSFPPRHECRGFQEQT